MKLFDGLYPYEIVLLVLGVFLFVVLVIALVLLVTRGKPFGKLVMFFAISIIMIGFPGVQSFEISASVIKIQKQTLALEQNPTDTDARESLSNAVASVSDRPLSDPRAVTTIAHAQLVLGNDDAAEARINKVLKEAPQFSDARDLKRRIELNRNLVDLTGQVEQNPGDSAARKKLEATVSEVTQFPTTSAETMTNIARAQKILGDKSKAQTYVDKALTINPKSTPALELKKQIKISPMQVKPDNH